jgi:hypothetical protein
MENVLDALQHVGTSFPTDEGTHLADVLLSAKIDDWTTITIDLRKMPAGLLISAFFNAFLQRIHEKKPDRLAEARGIKWKLAYPFQEKNVQEWMKDFEPYTP